MSDFTLDTSGAVELFGWQPHWRQDRYVAWRHLSPFEQGYVEALFASLREACARLPEVAAKEWPEFGIPPAGPRPYPMAFTDTSGRRWDIVWYGSTAHGEWRKTECQMPGDLAFSDLAPETLATIRKDCATAPGMFSLYRGGTKAEGEHFFRDRQNKALPGMPPLAVSLGDNGKVYARVSA